MTLETTTRTFLFTDLEGSTRLWEGEPEGMRGALVRHNDVVARAVEEQGGSLVRSTGDGFVAVFPTADCALRAALTAQLALEVESWHLSEPLRVRMGVHTDVVATADGEYLSPPLNRCSRLMSAAHGGQIICSEATAVLARAALGQDADLVDLGEHMLRDLSQPVKIFQLVHPGLDRDFPPLRTLDAYPTNLPVELSTFIGREHQLTEIAAVLGEARVVTLTGVGGVGKSRLALQVAADVIPSYRDGAWLVELAPIIDPDAIAEVVATSLGVAQRQGQSVAQSVVDFLRAKRLILIIDNCEHLLDAAARFIDEIVRSCPHVLVLATSREGLGVVGERMIAVPSLELPAVAPDEVEALTSTEAVRLFLERANEAKANFAMTDDNRGAIVRLCRRLDGIPLAIELAAARIRSLTPAELADRLDARFRLLAGGPRTAVERHQTLRRAIDWSYDLLSQNERLALMRLSVFAGTFTLDAAEAVIVDDALGSPEVLDLLGHLVDKSLVVAENSGDVTRYRLLETIRQYAQERLEDSGAAETYRQRHAEYNATFALEAGRRLRGRDEVIWTSRVEAELDNLRAALAWAQSTEDVHLAMRLIAPLALPGTRIGYASGSWAEPSLSLPRASDDPLFPEVQAWTGWTVLTSGDIERGVRLVREAILSADTAHVDEASMCRVLCSATGVLGSGGRMEELEPLAQRWVEHARSIADDYELAQALVVVGLPSAFAGDLAGALTYIDEAIEIARRLGNPTAITYTTMTAGLIQVESAPERALNLLDEALLQASSVGNNLGIGMVLQTSAYLHTTHGSCEEALRLTIRGAEHFYGIGDLNFLRGLLHPAVVVLARAGADESAAMLYGATPMGMGSYEGGEFADAPWVMEFDHAVESLQTRLGDERFAACAARGSRMDEDELVALLREEVAHLLSDPTN